MSEDRIYQITDPDWTDYVMTFFSEDEIVRNESGQEFPKVDGLRRVVESLFGPIVESKCTFTNFSKDNDMVGRAISGYRIKVLAANEDFIKKHAKIYDPNLSDEQFFELTCEEVADAWDGNTDDNFCAYVVALSATRAEARCLRKLLRLKKCSADEITREKNPADFITKNKPAGEWKEEDLLSDSQKSLIKRKCDQMKIDLMKFINSGEGNYESLDTVTKRPASAMISKLNEMSNNRSTIPDDIKL